MRLTIQHTLWIVCAALLAGCARLPQHITPVRDFDLPRYLGTWYEIARLDHSFERGLSRVTAEYSLREDGAIQVLNRGFNDEKQEWKQAEGRALVADRPDIGWLKVSFFGPFYASYVVFELDHEGYQYALVGSSSEKYLWILSRQPQMDTALLQRLLTQAANGGFDTNALLFVEHDE